MQSALFNHSQEEMSFPERKSVFHLHPEKSAGLDKTHSTVSEPRGTASEQGLLQALLVQMKGS